MPATKEAAQHRLHLPGHIARGLVILTASFWAFWGVVASGSVDLLLNERSCDTILRCLTRKP